jgi:hypothetical protein
MIRFLLSSLFVLAFATVFAVALLDWFSGCGQLFVYADGSRHMGECIGRETFFSIFK